MRTIDCCDLLRIYYFCTTNHIPDLVDIELRIVVICFEFIIFALRITSTRIVNVVPTSL